MFRKIKRVKHTKRHISSAYHKHISLYWIVLSTVFICIALATGILLSVQSSKNSYIFLTKNGVEEEYNELPGNAMKVKGVQNTSAVILNGPRDKKNIAITFDAEMTNGMKQNVIAGNSSYDERIIKILNQTHTKATLFITGMWAQLYPNEVKSFAKNPLFEIGSHSYADTAYSGYCYGLSPTADQNDLQQIMTTQDILKNLTGKTVKLFRFPGGCYDDYDIQAVTKDAHLSIVHWDVVGGDGFNENAQSIIDAVVNTTQNGSIIVLHMNGAPTAPKTAEALPEIISELKAKGFQFVTVSELLGIK